MSPTQITNCRSEQLFLAKPPMTGKSFKQIKKLQEKLWGDLDFKRIHLYGLFKQVKAPKNGTDERILISQENTGTCCVCRHYRRRRWRILFFNCLLSLIWYRPLCYDNSPHPDWRPGHGKEELKMGAQIASSLVRRCATIHRQINMKTIAHLPFLPDLAPVDFFLFPKVKT